MSSKGKTSFFGNENGCSIQPILEKRNKDSRTRTYGVDIKSIAL